MGLYAEGKRGVNDCIRPCTVEESLPLHGVDCARALMGLPLAGDSALGELRAALKVLPIFFALLYVHVAVQ